MRNALGQKFFNRPALKVAEDLLGKYLCRGQLGGETAKCYLITETEAYVGPEDKASHASRGRTKRNAPMFGEAGRWYVYFTYGMHWMLNIVTGPENYPAAILIRGTDKINGPARLTKFLGIDKTLNEKSATQKTGLWFEDGGMEIARKNIKGTPRVGVSYAGPVWSKKPYRFFLKEKAHPVEGRATER